MRPSSYSYFALCELDDALDNIEQLKSILKDDELILSILESVSSDIESAYDKLKNISL